MLLFSSCGTLPESPATLVINKLCMLCECCCPAPAVVPLTPTVAEKPRELIGFWVIPPPWTLSVASPPPAPLA